MSVLAIVNSLVSVFAIVNSPGNTDLEQQMPLTAVKSWSSRKISLLFSFKESRCRSLKAVLMHCLANSTPIVKLVLSSGRFSMR